MVHFKGVEELSKDLLFGSPSSDHIWVLLRVVGSEDVVELDHTISVLIHDAERSFAEVPSEVVHLTNDTSEELVVADFSGLVLIEICED